MNVLNCLKQPRNLMTALELWSVDQRPVFIVGIPRSGTTRLSNIISRSPEFIRDRGDVVETDLVSRLQDFSQWEKFGPLVRFIGGTHGARKILDQVVHTLREVPIERRRKAYVQAYFFTMHELCKPQRAVEKTPLHVYASDFLWSCFPKAKFICSYREPCDVYASMRRRRETEVRNRRAPDAWLSQGPEDFAKFYRDILRQFSILKHKIPDHVVPFSYKAFVSDPEFYLRGIFESIDAIFSTDALTDPHFEEGNVSDPLLYQPVKNYGQDWREYLSEDEASTIDQMTASDRDLMDEWFAKFHVDGNGDA